MAASSLQEEEEAGGSKMQTSTTFPVCLLPTCLNYKIYNKPIFAKIREDGEVTFASYSTMFYLHLK